MPPLVPPSAIADNLLELADSFGVFATLYASEQQIGRWIWENGSFLRRHSEHRRSLCITVRTADNRFGQAWTSNWSQPAVLQAFHMARRLARPAPDALACCRHLAAWESRLPVQRSPLHDREPANAEQAAFQAEREHHAICRRPNIANAETVSTVMQERLYAARSDGTSHAAVLYRTLSEHRVLARNGQAGLVRRGFTGSLPPAAEQPDDLSADELILPSPHSFDCTATLTEQSLSERLLVIDRTLLARIIYAWVHTEQHGAFRSACTIQAEAVEGSPGYCPIHPWGYLFAAMPLLSPAGCDTNHLAALRVRSFQTHLSVQHPLWLESPASSAEQLLNTAVRNGLSHGAEMLILDGAHSFSFDPISGNCRFLPVRMVRYLDGKRTPEPTVPVEIRPSTVLQSLLGGAGEIATAWGSPDSLWTVSAPRYVFVQWGGERNG